MTDYAALIKQTVTMEQVLKSYGLSDQKSYNKRIPCPIHHGKDRNFSYHHKHFKCFVCGASGDIFDFVMQYRGLTFVDAMREINDIFGLGFPIGENEPSEADREARRKAEQLRRERIARQNELKRLLTAYDAAMDYYAALDIIAQEDAPDGPYDEITPQYAYAVSHIDEAWDRVQDAAERLREFDKKGE